MQSATTWIVINLTIYVVAREGSGPNSHSGPAETAETGQPMMSPRDLPEEVQGDLSLLGTFSTDPLVGEKSILDGATKNIGLLSNKTSAYANEYTDPHWQKQWYLQDYRTSLTPVMDLNVVPVHRLGYTGRGVTVAVMDLGVEDDHPDLERNYNRSLAYDYTKNKPYADPRWSLEQNKPLAHGTNVAGVIAMQANNKRCGVGIAFNAQVTGVRILGRSSSFFRAKSSDLIRGRGLQHRLDAIDIYSNSWGPQNDGTVLNHVQRLVYAGISKGVTEGRGKLGAIYVFSAGNNKALADNCAADSGVNNPNVIAIAAADQWGKTTFFSESCTAVLATTYSGSPKEGAERLVATDTNGKCTDKFGGTSAAVALASGIIALVLEAKPSLTYRDVMHIIAVSSEVAPLANNRGSWQLNKANFMVSQDFGFGLLNAKNMVVNALNWKNVARKNVCVIRINVNKQVLFNLEKFEDYAIDTPACQDTEDDGVHYLEHIQLTSSILSLSNVNRGDMAIYITSPMGTVSVLMKPRVFDKSKSGFREYSITSVHTWGEDPKGIWRIQLKVNAFDKALPGLAKQVSEGSELLKPERQRSLRELAETMLQNKDKKTTAHVKGFTLILHGTKEKPNYVQNLRRYAGFITEP